MTDTLVAVLDRDGWWWRQRLWLQLGITATLLIVHRGRSKLHALGFEEATRRRLVEPGAESTRSSRIGTILTLVTKGVALVTGSMHLCTSMRAVTAAVPWFPTPSTGLFAID
jgi:hypothetical protein